METHADAVLVQVWNTDTLSPVFMLFFSFHGLTLYDSQFSIFIHLKQPVFDKLVCLKQTILTPFPLLLSALSPDWMPLAKAS